MSQSQLLIHSQTIPRDSTVIVLCTVCCYGKNEDNYEVRSGIIFSEIQCNPHIAWSLGATVLDCIVSDPQIDTDIVCVFIHRNR